MQHNITCRTGSALATGAVFAAAGLLVAPATADQGRTGSVDTGTHVIRSLVASNTGSAVTATAKLDRLPKSGEAAFTFDTGIDDAASMYQYHGWYVSIAKPAGAQPTYRFARNSSVTGKADYVCNGISISWDRSRARIRVSVPTSCFGDDRGMMRVGFQGPTEASHGSAVRTRPLQLGRRGAKYGDLNGDGSVDKVTTKAISGGRYRISADIGRRSLTSTGPLTWSGASPRITSRLDLNKDGGAEIIVNVGDIGGAQRYHLYTLAGGELRPVTTEDGRLIAQTSLTHAGEEEYPDLGYRCSGRTFQTWYRTGTGTDPVDLDVTSWTLDGASATAATARNASVDRSIAVAGNWSRGSCDTR